LITLQRRITADCRQLGIDGSTVEYVVEGWLRVAMKLLADGHSVPTVLGTIRTAR